MNDISPIERVVMRRVHTLHFVRPFVSTGALVLVVFVLALWGIGREVWVARVFENGPNGLFGHTRYLVYAFGHTRFIVQALSLLSLASLVYLARETARGLASFVTPAHA